MTLFRRRRAAPPPLPPPEIRFMNESDEQFLEIGDLLVAQLEQWAGLADGRRVLDVGCGYGRLAHALRRNGFRGDYLGLDVLPRHIEWCRRHLGGRRWRFRALDVHNERYNPRGSLAAEEVRLKRFAGVADLIVASSLFTHLGAAATRHYLSEFAAILAPKGRIYASFFILDGRQDGDGEGPMTFPFELGDGARYQYKDEPLRSVAYPGDWLAARIAEVGLGVSEVSYGTWGPSATGPQYQDVYVFGQAEVADRAKA